MITSTGSINSLDFGLGESLHLVAARGLRWEGVGLATSDQQSAGTGVHQGYARQGGRNISLRLGITAFTASAALDVLDDLVTATPQLGYTLIPLVVDDYTIDVRVEARIPEFFFDRPQRLVEVDLALFAPDPTWTAVPP